MPAQNYAGQPYIVGSQAAVDVNLIDQYGMCPGAQGPNAIVNPVILAEQFWQTIPLPVPKPTIPPGYAITGKPAFLVTGGTVAPSPFQTTTPLGPLSVTAKGTYQVTWGDGSTSGPFSGEGEAYPTGGISHTYDRAGQVDVTVVEDWTATWSLGGANGTLDQLQTRAVMPPFTVEQVQAVISQ